MCWNRLINILEDLNPISDWIASISAFIGAGAAVAAAIYAIKGYLRLIKDSKDQQVQINSLKGIVEQLQKHNELVDKQLLINSMPFFTIKYVSEFRNEVKLSFTNVGKEARQIRLDEIKTYGVTFSTHSHSVIHQGKSFVCSVKIDPNKEPLKLIMKLEYDDALGNRYSQIGEMIFNIDEHVLVDISNPSLN